MNKEMQLEKLTLLLTVITGPPDSVKAIGKCKYYNKCQYQGQTVLLPVRTNKAVDVVHEDKWTNFKASYAG